MAGEKYRIEGNTLIINDGVVAVDADDFHYLADEYGVKRWKLREEFKEINEIIISDDVTNINSFAFDGFDNLTSVSIPNGVTNIDVAAFSDCRNLTSITIPSRVTCIGNAAFYDCSSLKSIIIPNSVTSLGKGVFYYCESLESVTMSNSVTNIGDRAFSDCFNLKNITMPDSVESIDNCAFCGCTSLTNIIIPSSVTSIEKYAFSQCANLKNITIPDSVTDIGSWAFSGCENLTIICSKGSYAEKYAEENNIPVEYIDEHIKEQALSQIEDCAVYIRDIEDAIIENGAGTLTLSDFGDKHYNVQVESDSEIYTFKVSLPVNKTVGGVKVQGFKELGYIDVGKDEVGKTLKEIAENTVTISSKEYGSKPLNELLEKSSKAIER